MRKYICLETPGVITHEETGIFSIPGRNLRSNYLWILQLGSLLNECLSIATRIEESGDHLYGPLKSEKAESIRTLVERFATREGVELEIHETEDEDYEQEDEYGNDNEDNDNEDLF